MWELADEDHRSWTRIGTQFVKPINKGVEEAGWENLCGKFVEMNKEVNVRNPTGSSRATLWKMRGAKDRGATCCDQSYATKLSVGRRSVKSCGMRTSRVRLSPCRRRCGKWERGQARAPRLDGAEADLHVTLSLRGEREVGTRRCMHAFFLDVEQCLPLGGASRFALLVRFHLRVVQRLGSHIFWHSARFVFFSFFSGG